jgi:hypothetical protein
MTAPTPAEELSLEPMSSAEAAAALHEPGVGEAFRRDLAQARLALGHLFERLHRVRRAATVDARAGGVSSGELVARLQLGLRREHDLVLEPLLGRLDGLAALLNRGLDVPAAPIEGGLELIDRYLHELHDAHLHLLEIAGADPERGEPARLAFQQLASDLEHARVRWATVRVMLRGYEEKLPGARAMLGLTLAQECRAERAWHQFEELYVKGLVPPLFPPRVADAWRTELDRSREAGRADRTRVDAWVEQTRGLIPSGA